MICDQDPLRPRLREFDGQVKAAGGVCLDGEKMTEWPAKRVPITKIRPSDGCGRDAVPLAVERWSNFPELGGYLGNVG